jgi:large subunit ribosomal protein L17
MRHRLSRLRLRQKPAHSRSLQRNLVTSLILYEAVRTTKKRAEVIQPIIDHLITVAKTKQPQVAIRYINAVVTHKNASKKTMEVLKSRYSDRSSGFTRMVAVGSRIGDGAKLVDLTLIEGKEEKKEEKPAKAPAKKKETVSKTKAS